MSQKELSSAEYIWCEEFKQSRNGIGRLYGSQNIQNCLKNKDFAEDIKLWGLIKL